MKKNKQKKPSRRKPTALNKANSLLSSFKLKVSLLPLPLLWKWSITITLPISICFAIWCQSTYKTYHDFGVRHDSAPHKVKLQAVGKMEFAHYLNRFKRFILNGTSPELNIKTVDVFLNRSHEQLLNSKLPTSGHNYVPAKLLYPDGKIHKVKLKYRGDLLSHWGFYKKSTRIKTSKKNLYEGGRRFNIITPKGASQTNNHLTYYLARLLGLVTVDSDVVAFRVNGEYRGIHILAHQLTEQTLRDSKRMPGDIYTGESIGEDLYKGLTNNLFVHPGIWNKTAINNHYPEDHNKPLVTLLSELGTPYDKNKSGFWEMLDQKQWAKFSVLELLSQTYHYDNTHNWRLYYDPAKNIFEPLIWDALGWHRDWRPIKKRGEKTVLDNTNNRINIKLLNDYRFRIERQLALEEFFANKKDLTLMSEINRTVDRVRGPLSQDINVAKPTRQKQKKEFMGHLDELPVLAQSYLTEIKSGYLSANGNIKYNLTSRNSIRLKIAGRNMVRNLNFQFSSPITTIPKKTYIKYQSNKETVQVDVSSKVTLYNGSLNLNVPLLPRLIVPDYPSFKAVLSIKPATYEVIFEGLPLNSSVSSIEAHRGGGVVHKAEESKIFNMIDFDNGYAIISPAPISKPLIWSIDKFINSTMIVKNDLIINPGVNIYMGEGALLEIKGKLTAIGTEASPIKFIPLKTNKSPWGAVVLKGSGANESKISHCEFDGGSGIKEPLFEYSAMFSIHDVEKVVISNCHFKNNKVVDDMVHAVYSDITFNDSIFENAKFDALDLDISTAVINSSTFINNGNDSIDLMTTKAVVKNTSISGSGDKGISVGENSQLLVINTSINNNAIGVQSKDASTAVLYNVDLKNNGQSIHAYKKNWMYGDGGDIYLSKAVIENNNDTMSAEKKSHIWTYDSFIDKLPKTNKRLTIDHTVDSTNKSSTLVNKLNSDNKVLLEDHDFFDSHIQLVNPSKRGTF